MTFELHYIAKLTLLTDRSSTFFSGFVIDFYFWLLVEYNYFYLALMWAIENGAFHLSSRRGERYWNATQRTGEDLLTPFTGEVFRCVGFDFFSFTFPTDRPVMPKRPRFRPSRPGRDRPQQHHCHQAEHEGS